MDGEAKSYANVCKFYAKMFSWSAKTSIFFAFSLESTIGATDRLLMSEEFSFRLANQLVERLSEVLALHVSPSCSTDQQISKVVTKGNM